MAAPTNTPLYRFGAGQFWAIPNAGDLATNPTPGRLATLQEVSLEFGADVKMLYGENNFPEVVAVGKRKVSGKAKIGRWNTSILQQMLFAGTLTGATMEIVTINEQLTVPAMMPFTYTSTHAATYIRDLGAHYANGNPFTKLTPVAAGQYTVNESTGVYTFGSSDASTIVQVDYLSSQASGFTLEIDQEIMGWGPVFTTIFNATFRGQSTIIQLNACIATKFSLASKIDDFTVPELDFEAFADANGVIGKVYSSL